MSCSQEATTISFSQTYRMLMFVKECILTEWICRPDLVVDIFQCCNLERAMAAVDAALQCIIQMCACPELQVCILASFATLWAPHLFLALLAFWESGSREAELNQHQNRYNTDSGYKTSQRSCSVLGICAPSSSSMKGKQACLWDGASPYLGKLNCRHVDNIGTSAGEGGVGICRSFAPWLRHDVHAWWRGGQSAPV